MTRDSGLTPPLSRTGLDRDHAARERPGLLDELWADPATRVLTVLDGQALLAAPDADGAMRLALLPTDALARPALAVYLGRTVTPHGPLPVGTPIVAAQLDDAGHLAEADWADLRRVGADLADLDVGIFTEAIAVLNWHASHGFSPRTGEPTAVEHAGWVRVDPRSGSQVFPRTDPAVIVAVHDADDRILLGANALWESNRFSLLAGFVEPGESLEAAVVREVGEEAGVLVRDPRYLGSQPWPFPASLMLGFEAWTDDVAPTPDGAEIVALRWFTRAELAADVAAGAVRLPGRASIARSIIERWMGAPIDDGSG